jgi:thiol-disulfide isomerase/thioredoxin
MKNKAFVVTLVFLTLPIAAYLQVVKGTLIQQESSAIRLYGYKGFDKILLDSTSTNGKGDFELNFGSYSGMGFVSIENQKNYFIILNEKKIKLKEIYLKERKILEYSLSKENMIFNHYSSRHLMRGNVIKGLEFALIYYNDTLVFPSQSKKIIVDELKRLKQQDSDELKSISTDLYVSYFLPLRKLIDDAPLSVQLYPKRIPKLISEFRKIDFNGKRLYNSGLISTLIENHYLLLENSGKPLDSIYHQMNISTDYLISSLEGNDSLLNEVTNYLFDFLEKRSLFSASEYLALKMLTQNSCTLNDDLTKQLETYRIMKVGNIAPDIIFTGKKIFHQIEIPSSLKLSTMNNKYSLIVFGASWCTKCKEEIPKLTKNYVKWKQKGVEVVFISLDKNPEEFIEFTKEFPWLSVCDFKSWDTQAAQDYHVFSTPTMFLLDRDFKILLRPKSVEQADVWVNHKLN